MIISTTFFFIFYFIDLIWQRHRSNKVPVIKIIPNCTILDRRVFENFILADEPFTKALWTFEIYLLVNDNLWGKWVSSLDWPTTFDETFKATWVPFFNPDFNSLSCEWNILHLNNSIETFYVNNILKKNKLWNTNPILLQFLLKNLKWFLSLLQ